ncbi:MAG: NFACT family protein [Spirochaetales bacterium]|nr:NFACT family protein [Spirochaetales bacterium]
MSLNHKEIDLILSELELEGSHLQKIKQPNFSTLYLEFYKPGTRFGIIICLAPGKTRIHLTEKAPVNEVKLQRFSQFMRSRIRGGRILEIEQLNNDRIIRIKMLRAGEEILLWIRLWSGAANIIATDSIGLIHDAFYRRPGRSEVSGGVFSPPLPKEGPNRNFTVRELAGEDSFNKRICDYYENIEAEQTLLRLRERALKKLASDEARVSSVIKRLEKKSANYESFEEYKQTGDLLMSSMHMIKKGDKWIRVQNYYRDNEETDIELDPALSPEKNAEKYYTKYRKAKSGIEKVLEDLNNHRVMLKNTKNDQKWIESEDDPSAIEDFLSSVPKQNKLDVKDKAPGLNYRSGVFTILVGRNARENDSLLRNYVRGNDIWLHTRDYPGGYVFIKTIRGKSVPLETMLDAGNLALYYSKGKTAGKGELYYTQVKYLRRPKDGKKGLVIPTHEKNLSVILEQARLNSMMNPDSSES